VVLVSVSLALSQIPAYAARPVCLFSLASAGTHCIHPHRDGQAELSRLHTEVVYPPADGHPSHY